MTEVARGIHVVETSTADGKIGVVLGTGSSLAVDAGIDEAEGRSLADTIRRAGHRVDRLVYTHGHVDHVLGSIAFAPEEVIATADATAHIGRQLVAFAERSGLAVADLGARLGHPTVLVQGDDPVEIDVGGRAVEVFPTPGHAPGAACVLVPDARVLFGGDTVVTGIPPSFKDGDGGTMEATLRRLAMLEVDVLVPGHGPVVRGAREVRSAILWAADYLARCRDVVAAHPGAGVGELVGVAPYDALIGDRLPADRHRMVWRHEQTFAYLVAERERAATQLT